MSYKETKKAGFFQRLFGREPSQNRQRNASEEEDKLDHHHQHHHSPKTKLTNHGATGPPQTVKPPAKEAQKAGVSSSSNGGGGGRRPPGSGKSGSRQGRSTRSSSSSSSSKSVGSRRRSRRRKRRQAIDIRVDTAIPLVFPTTPEMVLAYHKAKPFLDKTEEWVVMSLIEYECMLDGLEVVRTMGRNSQFFEVEPEDLCEEFFEFVELVPSYDEVINDDIWQEFRYAKYNW